MVGNNGNQDLDFLDNSSSWLFYSIGKIINKIYINSNSLNN